MIVQSRSLLYWGYIDITKSGVGDVRHRPGEMQPENVPS